MDTTEKAFQYASEASKMITTLSSGIIALTVTFSKEIGTINLNLTRAGVLLLFSWLFLLGAASCGVWVQLAITQVLEPTEEDLKEVKKKELPTNINRWKIKLPFQIHVGAFILGMICVVIFGLIKIFNKDAPL